MADLSKSLNNSRAFTQYTYAKENQTQSTKQRANIAYSATDLPRLDPQQGKTGDCTDGEGGLYQPAAVKCWHLLLRKSIKTAACLVQSRTYRVKKKVPSQSHARFFVCDKKKTLHLKRVYYSQHYYSFRFNTLQERMFPKAENVSYRALLSMDLSRFLMKMFPTPLFLNDGSRWDHMIRTGRPLITSKFMVSSARSAKGGGITG